MTSTAHQPELWSDDWAAEADRRAGIDPDERAFRDLHGPQPVPYRNVEKVKLALDVL